MSAARAASAEDSTRSPAPSALAQEAESLRRPTTTCTPDACRFWAWEVFTTGNYIKVAPITRVEDRDLQPGPITKRARELYWEYAKTTSVF